MKNIKKIVNESLKTVCEKLHKSCGENWVILVFKTKKSISAILGKKKERNKFVQNNGILKDKINKK